ncbi:MAG: hypothetical protein II000_10435 [Clostridia bacterium]|nr:hypothetical protein [Clostridia bacterium]
MKRILSFILAALMILAIGCGSDGKDNEANDPNLGVYTAKSMTYSGITLDITEFFEEGFTIELQAKGKCKLTVDGQSANGKWTLDGTDFTVKGGGIDCAGKLEKGVIDLQYEEDVVITLVNPDYKEPAPAPAADKAEKPAENNPAPKTEQNPEAEPPKNEPEQGGNEPEPVLTEEYWLVTYSFVDGNGNETSFDAKNAGDMVKTYLKLNPDHSAEFMIAGGDPASLQWTDDGRLTIGGEGYSMDYATFERVDEYNVDVQMHTVTYHLSRMTAGGEAPAKADQPQAETATPVPEEPTAAPVTETRSGEPWGDSDGVISHEKLAGLYRWLKETSSDFWKTLTFDDVGEAVGKQGFDKKDGDGKYHAAYWTDGGKYYVNITFYNRDGLWTVGSITTGMNSSEYSSADISSFPVLGNRKAGSSPVKRVELDAKIGFSSGPKVGVSTDLPTENWFATVSSSSVRFSNAPTEKAVNSNTPGIRVECKESLEKIDFYKEKFENLKELAPWTIGGIQMQGRSYKYVGMEWIEYYGQIQDGVWASVTITGVDPYPGSEAEAILNTMAFVVK